MSLSDLSEDIDKFLEADKAERKRRTDFRKAWDNQRPPNGGLNALLQSAASLFSKHPEFAGSKVSDHHMSVTLTISFKSEKGSAVSHTLTFKPDEGQRHIVPESSLGDLPVSSLDLEKIDEVAESTVRRFIEALLRKLSGVPEDTKHPFLVARD